MTISNETWAAILGALVGSGIGGAISAGLQRWMFSHTTRERNQGLAYGLLVKLATIASHLSVLDRHVERALASDHPSHKENPTLALGPMPATMRRVDFSTDEIAVLLSMGDDNVTNALMMTDERHNNTLDLVGFYSERRIRLTDSIEPASVSPEGGTFSLKADQATQLRVAELDSLVAEIRQHLSSDASKALNVLQQVAGLFKTKLGVRFTALPTLSDKDL
ncbi:MAG: hypothetical protein ACHP84_01765 [Caulobacterales bacterium]